MPQSKERSGWHGCLKFYAQKRPTNSIVLYQLLAGGNSCSLHSVHQFLLWPVYSDTSLDLGRKEKNTRYWGGLNVTPIAHLCLEQEIFQSEDNCLDQKMIIQMSMQKFIFTGVDTFMLSVSELLWGCPAFLIVCAVFQNRIHVVIQNFGFSRQLSKIYLLISSQINEV